MAVLSGYLGKVAEVFGLVNPSIGDAMAAYAIDYWPPSVSDNKPAYFGTLTTAWPVEANGVAISGWKAPMYVDSYYYRVHITPRLIELGNISSPQTRTIEVWNAYLSNKVMTSFQAIDADGINVTQPVTTPYTFKALETLTYLLNVSTSIGPANIDASFIWTIGGEDSYAEVTGRRAIVFPFAPNFNADVTETLEWRSDILRTFDGNEQRRAVRTKARRYFEYKYTLTSLDQQMLQSMLWGWQNRAFMLPIWTDKRKLTQAQSIGNTTLFIDPTNYSFVAGGSAIIMQSPTNYEVVQLLTVTPTVTTARGLEKSWPIGTAVYPIVPGYMRESVPVLRYTDNAMDGSLSFVTSADVVDPYTPDSTAPITYDGIEVTTTQPNWRDNIDTTFDYKFSLVDMQSGTIASIPHDTYSRNTRKYSWLLGSRAEILDFRKFLGRRKGQVKTFWVPSWTQDFTVVANIAASDTSILFTDNLFRQMIGVNTAHNRIMFRMKTGQVFYRRITDVQIALDGVSTSVSIDTPLGTAFTIAQVKSVHMLNLCRLATDKIDIVWKSNNVATVDTTLMTVPA